MAKRPLNKKYKKLMKKMHNILFDLDDNVPLGMRYSLAHRIKQLHKRVTQTADCTVMEVEVHSYEDFDELIAEWINAAKPTDASHEDRIEILREHGEAWLSVQELLHSFDEAVNRACIEKACTPRQELPEEQEEEKPADDRNTSSRESKVQGRLDRVHYVELSSRFPEELVLRAIAEYRTFPARLAYCEKMHAIPEAPEESVEASAEGDDILDPAGLEATLSDLLKYRGRDIGVRYVKPEENPRGIADSSYLLADSPLNVEGMREVTAQIKQLAKEKALLVSSTERFGQRFAGSSVSMKVAEAYDAEERKLADGGELRKDASDVAAEVFEPQSTFVGSAHGEDAETPAAPDYKKEYEQAHGLRMVASMSNTPIVLEHGLRDVEFLAENNLVLRCRDLISLGWTVPSSLGILKAQLDFEWAKRTGMSPEEAAIKLRSKVPGAFAIKHPTTLNISLTRGGNVLMQSPEDTPKIEKLEMSYGPIETMLEVAAERRKLSPEERRSKLLEAGWNDEAATAIMQAEDDFQLGNRVGVSPEEAASKGHERA